MALHEHNTHSDVGAAIIGPPEDPKAGKLREFLSRPENLATALVLAAGLTSQRDRGQTSLNKALTSGVGALGFRGGIEQGVESKRAADREEQRTVTKQRADITAGQAVASQGQQRADALTQQVAQQAQARPLPQSQITLNKAQAELAGSQATLLGQKQELSLSFPVLLQENTTRWLELNPGVEFTPEIRDQITIETLEQHERNRLGEMGALTFRTKPGTDEIEVGVDTDRIPPNQLRDFPIHLPPLPPEAPKEGDVAAATSEIEKSLRFSGMVKPTAVGQKFTIDIMRRAGDFAALTDDELLDQVGDARRLAQDEARMKSIPIEQLENMLTVFGKALEIGERRKVRAIIRDRTGVTQRVIKNLGTAF